MSKDLRTFLEQVRKLGLEFYVEVEKRLSPELEVQAIQEKLAKEGRYPVIYCHEIAGSKLPLVTDLCGSYEMLGLALGLAPEESNKDKAFLAYRRQGAERRPVKMVPSSSAPVKEVVLKGKDVDLGLLPITKQAPLNSGKYITAGQLICRNPSTGVINSGIYRHEVKAKNKLGFKPAPSNHAGYITRSYVDLGKPMEVVIFIGHHPDTSIGSTWTGSTDVSELEVMGGYLGEPLEMTQAETVDLPVPARAEIVLEGIIDTSTTSMDGPFAEWLGYYGEPHNCYIIEIKAITMRRDAIYLDLDPVHWEHNFLCTLGVQSNTYDAVKAIIPTVKAVYMPPSGKGMITAYVSIKKRVPGEGKRAGWAAVNAYMNTKIAIVVDDDIDVYNEEEVMWAVASRCCPDIGVDIIPRMAGGMLDPTSYDESRTKAGVMNSKMVIDATKPVELPFPTRITPDTDVWNRIKLEDYVKGYTKP